MTKTEAISKAWKDAAMTTRHMGVSMSPDLFEQQLAAAGYVVVPKEPTREMTGAGEDADGSAQPRCGCENCDASAGEHYAIIYRAMIGADK